MARNRRRKRDTRMDAAVDTMAGFGFPEAKVKKHVRLLLKVYGGVGGWPFIEECTYKELLEAMLRDVDDEQDQETKTLTDGSDVGTSTRDEGPRDNGSPENTAIMPSGASIPEANNSLSPTDQVTSSMSTLQPANGLPPGGHLSNDVAVQPANSFPPGGHLSDDMAVQPANGLPPGGHLSDDVEVQPANSIPPNGRHRPCYGWIESDDDEDGFMYLKPMPGRFRF